MIRNLHIKILSLLFAVALWVGLVTGESKEVNRYVQVKLTGIPERYTAVAKDKLISVNLKGPMPVVNSMDNNDVVLEVNVKKLKAGENPYQFRHEDVKVPAGITVASIEPAATTITIDKFIKKSVKVTPSFIGDPLKGFKVEGVAIYPDSIEIDGAMTKLRDLNTVETLPVNLTGRNTPVTFSTRFKNVDGVTHFSPSQVDIYVTFKEDLQQAEFKEVQIKHVNLAPGFKAFIKGSVRIKVEARVDLLTRGTILEKMNFRLDLTGIKEKGKYLRPVKYDTPKGFKLIEIFPKNMRFEVVNEEVLRN